MNTDGAFDVSGQVGGAGFLLRNSESDCLLAGDKFIAEGGPYLNELLAIKDRVKVAIAERTQRIQIETDAELHS